MARFGVAAECDLAGELEASTMLKKQRTEWSFLQGWPSIGSDAVSLSKITGARWLGGGLVDNQKEGAAWLSKAAKVVGSEEEDNWKYIKEMHEDYLQRERGETLYNTCPRELTISLIDSGTMAQVPFLVTYIMQHVRNNLPS